MDDPLSDNVWEIFIELTLVVFVSFVVLAQVDTFAVGAAQRTYMAENFGLTLSLMSALPGNAVYPYLSADDKRILSWAQKEPVLFDLQETNLLYYTQERGSFRPPAYALFTQSIPESKTTIIDQNAFVLTKTDELTFGGSTLADLHCLENPSELSLHLPYYGEAGTFVNAQGEVFESAQRSYEGFTSVYYVEKERVYPAKPSPQGLSQAVISSGISWTQGPIMQGNTDLTIVASPNKVYAVAYAPPALEGSACSFLNGLIRARTLDGIALLPSPDEHLHLVLSESLLGNTQALATALAEAST